MSPALRPTAPAGTCRSKAVFDDASRWLRSFVSRGIELGVVRSDLDEEIAVLLLMALDGIHDRWLARHLDEMDQQGREAFTCTFVDLFRRQLSPAPVSEGSGPDRSPVT